MPPTARSTQWVFTHNNYTAADLQRYKDYFEPRVASGEVIYFTYGQEVSSTGTRHLQGYVVFGTPRRPGGVRAILPGCHIERARGTPIEARDYCHKDGDFTEYGSFAGIPFQGKRTEFDKYKEWLLGQATYPSNAHIAANWTSLYCRYGARLLELRDLLYPKPVMETGPVREGWQSDLEQELDEPPEDDRKIVFYVDEEGNKGKTWFIRYYMSHHDDAQFFGIAKKDDIAHVLDPTKRVFFFNIPRDQMQYLQYGILEHIKDRMVFSPKYMGSCKQLLHKPHVIVFCNEEPDVTKLSEDRFDVRNI